MSTEEERKDPIDLQALEELFGDLEMGKMMIGTFEKQTFSENAFMKILSELQSENMEVLAREAHSLKGACRYCPAPYLQDAAHALQKAAEEKNLEECNKYFCLCIKEAKILHRHILKLQEVPDVEIEAKGYQPTPEIQNFINEHEGGTGQNNQAEDIDARNQENSGSDPNESEHVDVKVAEEIYGDEETAKMMIMAWGQQLLLAQKPFIELYTPLIEKNYEVLERNAHSLKGSANYSGVKLLGQIAHEMQMSGKDKDLPKACKELILILEEAKIVYKIIFKEEGGELQLSDELQEVWDNKENPNYLVDKFNLTGDASSSKKSDKGEGSSPSQKSPPQQQSPVVQDQVEESKQESTLDLPPKQKSPEANDDSAPQKTSPETEKILKTYSSNHLEVIPEDKEKEEYDKKTNDGSVEDVDNQKSNDGRRQSVRGGFGPLLKKKPNNILKDLVDRKPEPFGTPTQQSTPNINLLADSSIQTPGFNGGSKGSSPKRESPQLEPVILSKQESFGAPKIPQLQDRIEEPAVHEAPKINIQQPREEQQQQPKPQQQAPPAVQEQKQTSSQPQSVQQIQPPVQQQREEPRSQDIPMQNQQRYSSSPSQEQPIIRKSSTNLKDNNRVQSKIELSDNRSAVVTITTKKRLREPRYNDDDYPFDSGLKCNIF